MAKDKKQRPSPLDPIGEDELKVAIEKAGYAVEVEVAEDFRRAGMVVDNGVRFRVGRDRWKEVDVRGVTGYKATQDALHVGGRVIVLVHVKRLHPPSWYVGITGHRPSDEDIAVMRGRIAGVPSFCCGNDEDDGLFMDEGGVMHAFGTFLPLPVCVHWAVAERNGAGEVVADATRPYFEDFHTLAVARHVVERAASLRLRRSSQPALMLSVVPVLVVDTPTLYVLDPFTKALNPVAMLSILQSFDGPSGPVPALIDVVTRAECGTYARMCCELRDRLKGYAETRVEAMTRAAAHARQQQKARDVERALDEYDTRGGILGE